MSGLLWWYKIVALLVFLLAAKAYSLFLRLDGAPWGMSKSKTILPSKIKCLHTNIFGTVPDPFWLIPRAGDLLKDDPMISLPWNPCCKAELEWKFTPKCCSCLAPAFLAFQRLTLDSLTDANSIAVKSRSLKSITRSASLKSAAATHETSNVALYEVGRDLLQPSLTASLHRTALGGKSIWLRCCRSQDGESLNKS